jgi:nucleoside-diphosphate-sugar epimerase
MDETEPADHPAPHVAWRTARERDVLDAAGGTLVTAVVRPGNVYGARGGTFGGLFRQSVQDGAPTVVGDGTNRWVTVHRADLSDHYIRILETAWGDAFQKLPGRDRLFHVVDGSSDRIGEIAAAASRAAGRDGTVRFQSVEEARKRMGPVADAVILDQVAATVRSWPVLGWRPRVRGFVANAREMYARWARS